MMNIQRKHNHHFYFYFFFFFINIEIEKKGIDICFNDEHSLKALFPIEITDEVIVILRIFFNYYIINEYFLKA